MATSKTSQTAKSNKGSVIPLLGAIGKSGFVVVDVGPQRQQYHVHKALITHHSNYFRNAFNGSWKEAQDKTVSLDDVDPMVFDIFFQWLYTQKLPTKDEWKLLAETYQTADEHNEEGSDTTLEPVLNQSIILTKALVFADRFLTPGFGRAANNGIVDTIHTETKLVDLRFLQAAKYVFEVLPEDHILVEFFIEVYCRPVSYENNNMNSEVQKWLGDFMSSKYLVRFMAKAYEITSYAYTRTGSWRPFSNSIINFEKWHKHIR